VCLARDRQIAPGLALGIFWTFERVAVEEEMLFHAPLTGRVQYAEGSKLDSPIKLFINLKVLISKRFDPITLCGADQIPTRGILPVSIPQRPMPSDIRS
jgi:hypothetical protein